LLNTRCPLPAQVLAQRERSVLDYGVPDFSTLAPQSSADQLRLAQSIRQTITAFEPRLQQVRVTVERYMDDQKALLVRLDAVLVVASVVEPIAFPLVLSHETGAVKVHGNL
jgi:type VI secretion system lysozyme-like protein